MIKYYAHHRIVVMIPMLAMFIALSLLLSLAIPAYAGGDYQRTSLKHQLEQGVPPDMILCAADMQLMLKTDGSPICVMKSSVGALTARGIAEAVDGAPSVRMMSDGKEHSEAKTEVMTAVEQAIEMYRTNGQEALDMITEGSKSYDASLPYPFVLDLSTAKVVAHGFNPDAVGTASVALTDSDKPLDQIMAELESEGSVWVRYVFTNPETGMEQYKRTWLALHDQYVFGSGYYITKAQAVAGTIHESIQLYKAAGADAFGSLTQESSAEIYPFVLDSDGLVVAHGADPALVGGLSYDDVPSGKAWSQVYGELQAKGDARDTYVFLNPATGAEQQKVSIFTLYDGYVFGSGYYLSE